jgi:hypothetical protein
MSARRASVEPGKLTIRTEHAARICDLRPRYVLTHQEPATEMWKPKREVSG